MRFLVCFSKFDCEVLGCKAGQRQFTYIDHILGQNTGMESLVNNGKINKYINHKISIKENW